MQKVKISFIDIMMFLMLWVFFSLNASFANVRLMTVLRWAFPIFFIVYTFVKNRAVINNLPPFLVVFIIAVLPSVVISSNVTTSLLKFISYILIFFSVYYYFVNSDKSTIEKCLIIFSIVAVIFQVLNMVFLFLPGGTDVERALGVTTNSNTLGIYANVAFWACIYLTRKTQNRNLRLVLYLLSLTSCYCAIASGSRTALVVLLLNLIVFLFLRFRRSVWLYGAVSIILLFVLVVFIGGIKLNIPAVDRFVEQGFSRDTLWEKGIEIFKKNPIFGCGYAVSNEHNDLKVEGGMYFHNSYVSFLADCGIWGVVFITLAFISIVKIIIQFFKNKDNVGLSKTPFIFLILLVDLMLAAWSESFLFAVGSMEGFAFWFLFVGLMLYMKKSNEEEIKTQREMLGNKVK